MNMTKAKIAAGTIYERSSRHYNFIISSQFTGKRLDQCLASLLPEVTRSGMQKLIKDGFVLVNQKSAKPASLVKANDSISVEIPCPKKCEIAAEDIPLNIVYEDADLIVINKSPDMVVHPACGNWSHTLVNALLFHCKDLSGIGGELKPGIVHRLDKGTSGIIVAAKNDASHLFLSKQFKDRKIKKVYMALVCGLLKNDHGEIDKPIGRSIKDRKKFSSKTRKGRIALTSWQVVKRFENNLSLVEVELHTGRTHQIRVHFAEMGYPLLGDEVYGFKKSKFQIEFKRPALHAAKIGFFHPSTNVWMEFEAPLAKDFADLLNRLEK